MAWLLNLGSGIPDSGVDFSTSICLYLTWSLGLIARNAQQLLWVPERGPGKSRPYFLVPSPPTPLLPGLAHPVPHQLVFQLWETQLPEASSIQSLPSSQILRCLPHSPSALTSVLGHTLAQMFSSSIMGSDTLIVHWNTLLCRCPAQLSGCKGCLGWPQLPPLFSPT